MTTGTEHEYSINDLRFRPRPVSDRVIKEICGSTESEILFGDVKLSKELQKTVLEFIPRRTSDQLSVLESQVTNGISKFNTMYNDRYQLLGLGMHPTLTLDRTAVWDHDEGEYYETYDRLFNIRQHGWLNLQALQINLSYSGEKDLIATYNRLRTLLPYLIAVTASSPMVEGKLTGRADNRLYYYEKNQERIPGICNRIIPEKIRSISEYRADLGGIYSALQQQDAGILCEEWVKSAGIIIRFSRKCVEIKALDAQECVRSEMAVCAFVRSLLRCPVLDVETDRDELISLMDLAIREGTRGILPELEKLYTAAWDHASAEERSYLPVIKNRIENGCLAEVFSSRVTGGQDAEIFLSDMAACLRHNRSFFVKKHPG